MNVLMVSKYGDSVDLALKLTQEHHDVVMYIKDKSSRKSCPHPFVVDSPTADMMKAHLNIVEDDSSGLFVSKLKELGRPVIGGGSISDKLVRNPSFMASAIEGCSLKVAGENTRGIPINVGGWFTGEDFIKPYFMGFRYDHIGAGDVGGLTKGMGLVGQYRLKGRLFQLLKSCETFLKVSNYTGWVGLNLFINNEHTAITNMELGLNFPTLSVVTSLHNSMGGFLYKVATGTARQPTAQPYRIGCGVVWVRDLANLPNRQLMVTYTGDTIEEATSKTYKSIHKINNPLAYYRIDIGSHYQEYMKQLEGNGWI